MKRKIIKIDHELGGGGGLCLPGCPKFDDAPAYRERLAEYFRQHEIKFLTTARREVPCCSGLTARARGALADSGKAIPFRETVIGVRGEKLK